MTPRAKRGQTINWGVVIKGKRKKMPGIAEKSTSKQKGLGGMRKLH